GRGGHGTDVRVVDVEAAWRESHEDLPGLFYQGGVEVPQGWEEHGTAVLGIMAGVDNGLGVHGIADQASYGAQSIFPSGVAAAIFTAATAAGEGGIVVLEVQAPGPWGAANCTCNWGQCGLIPMEYWQAEFDAIALATANCVIVVEAGANGSSDLDNPIYLGAFNRGVRDSGAIFVAASLKDWRMRICFSNHGSRMDLHAWGELIVTTGYGYLWAGLGPDQYYTNSFGGTSGATPIVAGAAAALQGAQKGYGRPPLAPENMLHVLRHGATPQIGTGIIGPMPNLRNSVSLLPYNPRVCSGKGKPQVPNLPQYPDENEPQ
ncbi:MAG: S8 family serine peptidase, partial [Acidobacteria bacterium]|nr:S8 family serine peptidase [Acidobacteriota bacterium]